jgi:hypothetical protein
MGNDKKAASARLRYAESATVRARRQASNRRWHDRNVDKVRAYRTQWARVDRAKDPDKAAAALRKQRGMPEPTRTCPSACECCGFEFTRGNGRKGCAHLDHDHKTGRFRGWLCVRCNAGIGLLGDYPQSVCYAVHYLERFYGKD